MSILQKYVYVRYIKYMNDENDAKHFIRKFEKLDESNGYKVIG